jgi:lysozyme family protein
MADFLAAYEKTNKREGMVLSNVPTDRGGMTFGGISRVHHPRWPGWAMIDKGDTKSAQLLNLHRGFYLQQFWEPLMLNGVISQPVAEKIYDTAVNCGPDRATRWAQTALNLANRGGREWPDTVVDGKLGPASVNLLNAAHKLPAREWLFLQVYESQQEMHYVNLALKDPSQEHNLLGWYKHRILHRKES